MEGFMVCGKSFMYYSQQNNSKELSGESWVMRKIGKSSAQKQQQIGIANSASHLPHLVENTENTVLSSIIKSPAQKNSLPSILNNNYLKKWYFFVLFMVLLTFISATSLASILTSFNNTIQISNTPYSKLSPQKNISVQTTRILQGNQDGLASSTLFSRAHNLKIFKNLLDFLNHNNIETIFQINCDLKCEYYFEKVVQFPRLVIEEWDGLTSIQYQTYKVYDWINCESFEYCIDLFLNNQFLLSTVKHGVSFRNDKIQEFDLKKIIKFFEDNGFYYDDVKSLNLMRPQDKMIMLFIRGKPEELVFPFKKPTKNAIGIHLVMKMVENIEYMREWIGYHLNLGVDKIFVYDNSNSIKSEMAAYDYLVTPQTTKIGLNLACFNKTRQQVKKKWEEIWLEFYDHIVYVPWEPKDSTGEIIYGQMRALDDYFFYFKHIIEFTSYTDPDEFIFSPDNLDLEQYLRKRLSQNITTLRIKSRHFPHRVCGKNKRVSDLVHYYPHTRESSFRMWAPKILCVTKYYRPWGSIHDGVTLSGLRLTPPENQLRFNHYTFEYFNLVIGLDYYFSDATKLLVDDSLQKRYSKVIDDICKYRCSQNFALSCPPDKQFLYCIDADETLPVSKPDAENFKKKLEQKGGKR